MLEGSNFRDRRFLARGYNFEGGPELPRGYTLLRPSYFLTISPFLRKIGLVRGIEARERLKMRFRTRIGYRRSPWGIFDKEYARKTKSISA
jgi:hypothetical protein